MHYAGYSNQANVYKSRFVEYQYPQMKRGANTYRNVHGHGQLYCENVLLHVVSRKTLLLQNMLMWMEVIS